MPRADKPHTGCGRVYLATRVGGEHGEVPIFLLPAPRQKINKWVLLRNATGSGPPRPGSPPRGQDWLRPVGTRLRSLSRSKPGTWGLASPPARAPPSPCSLGGYMGRSLGRGGGLGVSAGDVSSRSPGRDSEGRAWGQPAPPTGHPKARGAGHTGHPKAGLRGAGPRHGGGTGRVDHPQSTGHPPKSRRPGWVRAHRPRHPGTGPGRRLLGVSQDRPVPAAAGRVGSEMSGPGGGNQGGPGGRAGAAPHSPPPPLLRYPSPNSLEAGDTPPALPIGWERRRGDRPLRPSRRVHWRRLYEPPAHHLAPFHRHPLSLVVGVSGPVREVERFVGFRLVAISAGSASHCRHLLFHWLEPGGQSGERVGIPNAAAVLQGAAWCAAGPIPPRGDPIQRGR